MYWTKERGKEIEDLENKIKKAAFIEGKRIIQIRKLSPPHPEFKEDVIPLNSFIYQLAEIIWKHKQHTKSEEVESLLDSAKEENKRQIKRVEEFLQNTQWFSKNAIKKALVPLSDYLDKQIEESKKASSDFKYFVQANPDAHAWKFRENQLISQIRTFYNKYTPLHDNDYEISYNMSLVFEACNLWPNIKGRHEAMRKRFQSIDKNPEKFYPEEEF